MLPTPLAQYRMCIPRDVVCGWSSDAKCKYPFLHMHTLCAQRAKLYIMCAIRKSSMWDGWWHIGRLCFMPLRSAPLYSSSRKNRRNSVNFIRLTWSDITHFEKEIYTHRVSERVPAPVFELHILELITCRWRKRAIANASQRQPIQ